MTMEIERLITTDELADLLSVDRNTVSRLVEAGKILKYKVSRCMQFKVQTVTPASRIMQQILPTPPSHPTLIPSGSSLPLSNGLTCKGVACSHPSLKTLGCRRHGSVTSPCWRASTRSTGTGQRWSGSPLASKTPKAKPSTGSGSIHRI